MIPGIETSIYKLKNDECTEIAVVSVVVAIVLWTKVGAVLTIGMMIYLETEVVFILAIVPEFALCDEKSHAGLEARCAYRCGAISSGLVISKQTDLEVRMKKECETQTAFHCFRPLASDGYRSVDLSLHIEGFRYELFFVRPYFIILTVCRE